MKNYLKIIKVNEYSIVPKYLQITNGILDGIKTNQLSLNDLLPSINDLSEALDVARNTVERSYRDLKSAGTICSVAGKGYFISKTEFSGRMRVLLLFNKLSSHKKIIYDSFADRLGDQAFIDLFVYNNDYALFHRILQTRKDTYDKFVIVPHFMDHEHEALALISTLPLEKLILMDKVPEGINGDFGAVYEDFERDIYFGLNKCLAHLQKYTSIKLIFPFVSYYSRDIMNGFITFCKCKNLLYKIIPDLEEEIIEKGTVYINLSEDHLIRLIELVQASGLEIGSDIGVISYNDSPIKKVLMNGITTISTDFKMMGQQSADMLLTGKNSRIKIPFEVNFRHSL
jgi:DNA-binding transcriptional regulator YhcF (GntR family)